MKEEVIFNLYPSAVTVGNEGEFVLDKDQNPLKHESSSSNNLVLASDGNVSITNTLSAGTIGANVNIADGASPHGWQHIGTKHYNVDTAPVDSSYHQMVNEAGSNLTVSSDFSAYKIYFQISNTAGVKDLYFRFMTATNNYHTLANYYYYANYIQENGGTANLFSSNASNEIRLATDSFANAGGRGYQGEITFFNAYASANDEPTIDGNEYDSTRNDGYSPHGYFNMVGHSNGAGDRNLWGGFKIGANVYVTGFAFFWGGNANMYKGSWTSLYGLKIA
jgi:hypothetical protein